MNMKGYLIGDLQGICREILINSRDTLLEMGEEGKEEVKDDMVYDISTKGDRKLAQSTRDFLKDISLPAVFCDEELGVESLVDDPRFTVVFDDIDGTNNSARGKGTLPYCTAVAIFDKPLKDCAYRDVAAAGVLEHRTGNLWLAGRGLGCSEFEYVSCMHNAPGGYFNSHVLADTSGKKVLDKKTVVAIEGYETGRQIVRFADIFEHAWVKDASTSALELAGVACGIFDAFIHPRHKKDELPAGYLLIKEAGGCIADFSGKPLDDRQFVYDANVRTDIVAAATPALNETLRSLIKPA